MRDRLSNVSLATAITVGIVLSTLVGTTVVGLVLWQHSRAVTTDLAAQALAAAELRVAVAVQGEMNAAERVLDVNQALAQDLLQADLPLSYGLHTLATHCEGYRYVTGVYIFAQDRSYLGARRWPDGSLTVGVGSWGGEESSIARYQWLSREHRQGEFIANLRFDPSSRDWFQEALRADAPHWTSPYNDALNGQITLTTASAVRDGDGHLLAVVAVDLHLVELRSLLRKQVIAPGGQVVLLDMDGRYLVGSQDPEDPSAPIHPPAGLIAAYERDCGGREEMGKGCRFEVREGGRRMSGQSLEVRSRGGLAWNVLATVPEDAFLATVRRSERLAGFMAILGLFIAALLGWGLSRRISWPIEVLIAQTSGIGHDAGEIALPLGPLPRAFREVRLLGDTLREMSRRLVATVRSLARERDLLEARVTERTQELEEANIRLERLAAQDGLTGIANRRRFDEFMDQEWRRAERTRRPLALLLCDIDFFKRYNDTFGHLGGDDCLRQVAGAIGTCVRTTDLAARFGGEEFAILLPETSVEGGIAVANRIRKAVEELDLPHPAGVQLSEAGVPVVTVSLGVAIGPTSRIPDSPACIAAADRALYRAKQQGRNQVIGEPSGEPLPPIQDPNSVSYEETGEEA